MDRTLGVEEAEDVESQRKKVWTGGQEEQRSERVLKRRKERRSGGESRGLLEKERRSVGGILLFGSGPSR